VEGGSWHVRVSLAQVGQWLRGLGRVPDGFSVPDQHIDEISDLLGAGVGLWRVDRGAPRGPVIGNAGILGVASEPLGNAAEWLPR
jgi:hypothetical protein